MPNVVVRAVSPPDNLVSERVRAEHAIEHDLEVVARRGVAVQVQRARRLEDAVHLDHSVLHPTDVVVYAPRPTILERSHLCFVAPYDLVVLVGEEGRVEVDEVN